MALGVDTASQLNWRQDRWEQFLTKWGRQPTYCGRYFGDTTHNWVPGELLSLLANSPSAQSLRYILPFAAAGHITRQRENTFDFHGQKNQLVQFDVQGETRLGVPLKREAVRKQASKNAHDTCEAIAAALRYVDPLTQQHELVLPDSEAVFLFLNVEPQTMLNPYYWLGWAETVSSFSIFKETAAGTLALTQPLRPCLYCVCDENGPWEPEIKNAFSDKKVQPWNDPPWRYPVPVRLRGRHPCHALATPWPFDSFDVPGAIDATEADVQAQWLAYGKLQTPSAPEAEVVIWQYRINIGMNAGEQILAFSPATTVFDTPPPNSEPVPIDVSATSSTLLNGHPITDFMLRRP